jgi:ElaA protein
MTGSDAGLIAPVPQWRCQPLGELPAIMLYRALALRSSVFVVEQGCIYQDADGSDLDALLVIGSLPGTGDGVNEGEVVATARVLPPGSRYAEASIGRVCTSAGHRGRGLGRMLVAFAIDVARTHHPRHGVRISAQAYLERFYRSFGFEPVSPQYLEDGIPHLEMRLPPR